MKKNVLIIYGSDSTEHDISILSAMQIYNAVDKDKYNVTMVYISRNGKWYTGQKLDRIDTYKNFDIKSLKEVSILPNNNLLYIKHFNSFKPHKKVDCAILSLHGKNGEDGTIQGLLELAKIPYTSSGVLGSCVGLDKILMKQIFEANNVPITKHEILLKSEYDSENFDITRITKKLKFPVVVKPNSLGSSIGISFAKNKEELLDALNIAFMFDDKVIIEKCIKNLLEVNISVLGDGADCILSQTEEVQNESGLLSFEKKYLSNTPSKTSKKENLQKNNVKWQKNSQNNQNLIKKDIKIKNLSVKTQNNLTTYSTKIGMQNLGRIMPARISKEQSRLINRLAKKIFEITNSKGVVRIDFMIDKKTSQVYANEINTIPGSFAFYLWQRKGYDFTKLADKLIDIAINHFKQKSKLLSTFNSSVLGDKKGIK